MIIENHLELVCNNLHSLQAIELTLLEQLEELLIKQA